jgi:hypothetical protein
MSIQDDIFDVEDALRALDEAKCFDRIHTHIGNLERQLEAYRAFYNSAVDLKMAMDKISQVEK